MIGFDLLALATVADTLGVERDTLAGLLPFAETGMLMGIADRKEKETEGKGADRG